MKKFLSLSLSLVAVLLLIALAACNRDRDPPEGTSTSDAQLGETLALTQLSFADLLEKGLDTVAFNFQAVFETGEQEAAFRAGLGAALTYELNKWQYPDKVPDEYSLTALAAARGSEEGPRPGDDAARSQPPTMYVTSDEFLSEAIAGGEYERIAKSIIEGLREDTEGRLKFWVTVDKETGEVVITTTSAAADIETAAPTTTLAAPAPTDAATSTVADTNGTGAPTSTGTATTRAKREFPDSFTITAKEEQRLTTTEGWWDKSINLYGEHERVIFDLEARPTSGKAGKVAIWCEPFEKGDVKAIVHVYGKKSGDTKYTKIIVAEQEIDRPGHRSQDSDELGAYINIVYGILNEDGRRKGFRISYSVSENQRIDASSNFSFDANNLTQYERPDSSIYDISNWFPNK